MALNRAPTAIQVNGAALLVKGDASGLFASYQRVPGLANLTLPDETGSTNEVQLMDGSVAFSQIAGVGTITGSIGAISGHAAHRWLAAKRRNGEAITVTIIRPATQTVEIANTDACIDLAAASGGKAKVTVAHATDAAKTAAAKTAVKGAIKEGVLAAVKASAPSNTDFYSVLRANEDGGFFEVEPGGSAVADANGVKLFTRRPGIVYEGLSCTVNGLGDGDFQSGGAVSSSISLSPAEALPAMDVMKKVISEMSSDYDSVFVDIS